ncbi:hypothetical protein PAMP_002708 [Pampus punctatissimus]
MNLMKNRTLHPHLRDEEALVVENAIRLAIDSIINVLYGVNSARTHEYQRMVADRDKEIQRLECRLTEIEKELQVLRRQGCSCGLLESQTSGDRQEGACIDPEMTAGQPECEMSISLGLFARPHSHISSQSQESALPSSPSRMGADQTCTSQSSEVSGVSEAVRNLPASPSSSSSIIIKEEPCDIDAVLIKWEMSEERCGEHQENVDVPCQSIESLSLNKKLENREREKFREKPQADPGGLQSAAGEHLRNKKKSVPMSELPEEAQRLKRAAWRAASRRYYARKIARQQTDPLHPGPFPHITDSHQSQPTSYVDKRRRTLISELPQESQTMQREAWRAASRRYYARKIARHQTEPTQYGHFLQNIETSDETQGANTGGSHTSSGGIMCS